MARPKAVPLDHLRGKKKPVVRSVEIFLDSEVAEEINRAKVELERLDTALLDRPRDMDLRAQRDEAADTVQALQDKAIEDEAVVSFSFRGIGDKAFERLLEDHPPLEEQQRKAREQGAAAGLPAELTRLRWNADTFPPALVAAASLEPKISHDEAMELYHSESWNAAELHALFQCAQNAQHGRDVADLGKSRSGSTPKQG